MANDGAQDDSGVEHCDRCFTNSEELVPITTVVNGVEQKEWVCPSCEEETREDEKPPEDDSGTPHGYSPPEREKTDCDRCGEDGVLAFVDRKEPALCDDCEEYVANLEPPNGPHDEREITPMDRRWR